MKIARILYPVHVLGPGERVAIWTFGCEHGCPGCANPELWKAEYARETDEDGLRRMLSGLAERGPIDGITVTGGDPFYDPDSLQKVLSVAEEYTEDILVYTGYLMEELTGREDCQKLFGRIAVLIDGPYLEAQNHGHVLRGSDNQDIHYLKERFREPYEAYIARNQGKYPTENFPARDGVISVGIHKPDFRRELSRRFESTPQEKQPTDLENMEEMTGG